MPNRLAVFVPASPTSPLATRIARGSGIVGPAESYAAGTISVDYEGAVYGQANLVTYADRVRHAADRQLQSYPTVARCVVPRSDLRQVGWFDPDSNTITLLDDAEEALAPWLGVDAIDPQELHFSGPVPRSPRSLTNELP
jgi:hypothetical protein